MTDKPTKFVMPARHYQASKMPAGILPMGKSPAMQPLADMQELKDKMAEAFLIKDIGGKHE